MREVGEVHSPFGYEFSGNVAQSESEEVVDLCREYGKRNAGGESDYDRVRDELDYRAEAEESECNQNYSGHQGCYGESFESESGDYVINDYNECSGWTADLDSATSCSRNYETAYYGSDESDRGADAACDAECNGERESHDAYYDACHEVIFEFGGRVISECGNELRFEIDGTIEIHVGYRYVLEFGGVLPYLGFGK